MVKKSMLFILASLCMVLTPTLVSAVEKASVQRVAIPGARSGHDALASSVRWLAQAGTVSDADARRYLTGNGGNTDELLPPDQAFTASISAEDANTLVAVFTPAKGYFLYRDKFVFRVQQPPSIQVADVGIPRGETKDDPIFGKTEVFHEPVRVLVRLKRDRSSAGAVVLYVRYQGCNEPLAVCYVPIEKNLHVALPPAGTSR